MLLRRELGDIDIEDLPLPFLLRIFEPDDRSRRRPPAGAALAVAARLGRDPGVLPPVFQGGEVFVDGGAMNNLPVDVMRAKGRGP
jgi:predicted acylesterase/phospholipase RssA